MVQLVLMWQKYVNSLRNFFFYLSSLQLSKTSFVEGNLLIYLHFLFGLTNLFFWTKYNVVDEKEIRLQQSLFCDVINLEKHSFIRNSCFICCFSTKCVYVLIVCKKDQSVLNKTKLSQNYLYLFLFYSSIFVYPLSFIFSFLFLFPEKMVQSIICHFQKVGKSFLSFAIQLRNRLFYSILKSNLLASCLQHKHNHT